MCWESPCYRQTLESVSIAPGVCGPRQVLRVRHGKATGACATVFAVVCPLQITALIECLQIAHSGLLNEICIRKPAKASATAARFVADNNLLGRAHVTVKGLAKQVACLCVRLQFQA